MTDIAGGHRAPEPGSRQWRLYLPSLAAEGLRPIFVWNIAGFAAAMIALSFWQREGAIPNILFTAGITFALAAAITLLTRRVLISVILVAGFIALVNGIASAKRDTLGMVFHAYDIVFYLTSWSTVAYLWFAARSYVVLTVLAAVMLIAGAWIAWRVDATRVARRKSALALIASIAVAAGAAYAKPERRQTQFYWNALYVSSFYSSWAETLETLWRGQLIESARSADGQPFLIPTKCTPERKPPHIILIHQESVVQPALFPTLNYDRSVDSFFRSIDGETHKMRVETYGGASWLTEFSILTGLSTHSFGGMRPFVQSLLAGKVRDTLPEALQRCGYRNVLFYPMLKNFVSNARFYNAIGMREIYDLQAQKAPTTMERDRFYYKNAMDEMERHIHTSSKPLFTYIQTMSAHWPYDYAFAPEMKVSGGGPGTDSEMNEYLRRLSISKLDYDEMRAELVRRFPGEPILIVQYGDHQPLATRKLLGFQDETEAEEIESGLDSLGFLTFFSVDAINYKPPPLGTPETVDVPYLGAIMLQQAGLPLSEAYRERLRLMASCHGRYHGCAQRQDILAFHRRLIESKVIDER